MKKLFALILATLMVATLFAACGTNAPANDTKIEGVAKTLTTNIPTKSHYVFKGWARSKNATIAEYAAGGSYQRDANVTLYAVWEPETYTIAFDGEIAVSVGVR